MARSLPFALWAISYAVVASAQSSITVSLAPKATSVAGISQNISPSFAGFGIEPSNLYSFTGAQTANSLSINLMQNLANYSGAPGHIRVGGNTGDNMIYDASFQQWSLGNNPKSSGQGNVASDLYLFGPTYWEAINRFPKNTPVTFGLNMAYEASDYIQNIVTEASAALKGLTNVKLASFEIGNEVDLYLQNGFRTGSWGGSVYSQEWKDRAGAVYEQVLKPAGLPSNFFEPAATASTIGTSFEITQLANQFNLLVQANDSQNTYVASWNQHDYLYFIGVSTHPITVDWVMDIRNTEDQFTAWTTQISQAFATGYPYALREMASVGPIGLTGVSDVFGAALWNFNFFLYAATLNISSVEMHMTDNSFAAPWQPVQKYGKAPYVRPTYCAWAAMAQLIGAGNGTTQIASLTPPTTSSDYTGRIRMYAAYSAGSLSAVVILNTKPSNASVSSKPSLSFTLNLGSSYKGQTLYISTLTAQGADSLNGTTWNGISYETNGDGTPKSVGGDDTTVQCDSNGVATVSVRDSQAIIANVGFKLGTNTVAAVNGTTTTSGSPKPATTSKTGSASTSATGTGKAIAAASTTAAVVASPSATQTGAAVAARLGRDWRRTLVFAVVMAVMSILIYQRY